MISRATLFDFSPKLGTLVLAVKNNYFIGRLAEAGTFIPKGIKYHQVGILFDWSFAICLRSLLVSSANPNQELSFPFHCSERFQYIFRFIQGQGSTPLLFL